MAHHNLGVLYNNGQGVPQESVLAHMWYSLSDSQGYEDAINNKELLEDEMSPQKIEKAKEMARNWKTKK